MKKFKVIHTLILPFLILAIFSSVSADLFHNHGFADGYCCSHEELAELHTCPVFSILMNFSSNSIFLDDFDNFDNLIAIIYPEPEKFFEQEAIESNHSRDPPASA